MDLFHTKMAAVQCRYLWPESNNFSLCWNHKLGLSGTSAVEPRQAGLIYIQVMGAEQRADVTWHGSWLHQWRLAGPPPQPWDPEVKTLCSISGMKAAVETCDFGLCLNSWGLTLSLERGSTGYLWEWMNSSGSLKKKRNQISTFPDVWLSSILSFLSKDLFGNRCSVFGWADRQEHSVSSL